MLRNCEKLSFAGVEKAIATLGRKAREVRALPVDVARAQLLFRVKSRLRIWPVVPLLFLMEVREYASA